MKNHFGGKVFKAQSFIAIIKKTINFDESLLQHITFSPEHRGCLHSSEDNQMEVAFALRKNEVRISTSICL